jgi:O-antigen/teichoic acid export membrane protein
MGNIRKQAIFSSILLYIGFFVGAVNIFLYTKTGSFTEAEFGLTRLFFDFAQNMYAFGSLGAISVLYKFYPYYKDNLPDEKNDLLTWTLVAAAIGFLIVVLMGIVFQPFVVKKFIRGSKLFLDYYYWVFPFALGMLFFSVLEGFSWALQQTVLSNFLKETVLRLITTVFILLFYFKVISFPTFIHLFAFLYIIIFIVLVIHLIRIKKFYITFHVSRVTKRFWKKMVTMQSLIFSGMVIQTIGQTINGILIASLINISTAGIFTLAQYMANLVQVPQRSLQSISVGALARAWKDKDYKEINRIYSRSCINMLLMALFIFCNLLLNAQQAIIILGIKTSFLAGIQAMVVLGIARVIDAGTGVNGIIIGTSNYWRFDFISGIVLLALIVPTNYIMIKAFGIIGSAYADVISYVIYNFIRFEFLRRKFKMQPFRFNNALALVLAAVLYFITYYTFRNVQGWTGMILRSGLFSVLFIAATFAFQLSPDVMQLYHNFLERRRK